MSFSLKLPKAAGGLENYRLIGNAPVRAKNPIPFNRIAYSAAQVVAGAIVGAAPGGGAQGGEREEERCATEF